MNLVDFQGLNCYQNSIISIADYMGINYSKSFSTLWSETDFLYDTNHKIYLSKRIIDNFEKIGIMIELYSINSKEEAIKFLSIIEIKEPFIVGMDTFHIPWTPGYGWTHDVHYFVVQKYTENLFICFDPTYNKKYIEIIKDSIISHISKIYIVRKAKENYYNIDIRDEAKAVVFEHPKIYKILTQEFYKCVNEEHKNALMLAKYIDTMVNNRYLYKYYLENSPIYLNKYNIYFNDDLFLKWKAIKNGLYKAYIIKKNEYIIQETFELFTNLIDDEIFIANKIMCF